MAAQRVLHGRVRLQHRFGASAITLRTRGDEALHVTPEDADVKAWVPGTPVPAHTHAEGTAHTLTVDWILEEDSVDELTDHSALIINGRVESTRFDVIRTWAIDRT